MSILIFLSIVACGVIVLFGLAIVFTTDDPHGTTGVLLFYTIAVVYITWFILENFPNIFGLLW